MSAPRLLFDEDINAKIMNGVLERAEPEAVTSVWEVGLEHRHDSLILGWAATRGYIVVTHDTKTMTRFANNRVAHGEPMPGVIVVPQWLGVGPAIEQILLILGATDADEWSNLVVFLPLK